MVVGPSGRKELSSEAVTHPHHWRSGTFGRAPTCRDRVRGDGPTAGGKIVIGTKFDQPGLGMKTRMAR